MFALGIYDRVANCLSLARDRFGVKPLYYAVEGGYLLFASEIKALLASGCLRARLAPEQLVEYLTFQNLFGNQTLVEGVKLLGPGGGGRVPPGAPQARQIRRYHAGFPTADPVLTDEPAAVARVAEAFADAVRRQLVSDVEVGSYLSGGMDSGSIVAVAG